MDRIFLIYLFCGFLLPSVSFAVQDDCGRTILMSIRFGMSNPLTAKGYLDLVDSASNPDLSTSLRVKILTFFNEQSFVVVKVIDDPADYYWLLKQLNRIGRTDAIPQLQQLAGVALHSVEENRSGAIGARLQEHRDVLLNKHRSYNRHYTHLLADEPLKDALLRNDLENEPLTPVDWNQIPKLKESPSGTANSSHATSARTLEFIERIDNDLTNYKQKFYYLEKLAAAVEGACPFPELTLIRYESFLRRLIAIKRRHSSEDRAVILIESIVRALSTQRLLYLASAKEPSNIGSNLINTLESVLLLN